MSKIIRFMVDRNFVTLLFNQRNYGMVINLSGGVGPIPEKVRVFKTSLYRLSSLIIR